MKKRDIFFILISLCFLIYANSLHNAFVSDDIGAIINNPSISSPLRSWLGPAAFLNSLNYLIAKFNPFTYHLTNILLHSLNTVLVFLFLHLFFKTEASFLGACLFAVHPIHTEAVTWVSGKPYIITSLFILSAYLLYDNATKGEKGSRINLLSYWLSFFIFSYYLIANLSFYFIFPFLLVFSDITFKRARKNWKYWLPFLGVVILRLILARSAILQRASSLAGEMGSGVTWTNPIFNFAYSFFSHLRLLLWPAKLTLYHEPAVISSTALKIELFFLFLLLLSLPFIYKKAKELFFGIGIFVLFLTPTYSPVMVSWLVAERYLYFPSIILSIFLAFFYERYGRYGIPISVRTVPILIIAGLAVRTVARNEDWKSPERFWRQTLLVSNNSMRAHNNMGDIYAQEGNVEGAIREFNKAIALKPNYADAYHNLATIYYRKNDLGEAIKLYQQAIKFNPQLFESQFNLGIIYLNTGKADLAIKQFQEAIAIRPEDVNARTALDIAIKNRGR